MRAVFCETIPSNGAYEVSGDRAHHLINVIRVKPQEEILLLNGQGEEARAEVIEIKKKSLTLKIIDYVKSENSSLVDLAIAVTKKEALEEILKFAVELQIGNIYFLKTKYSQPFQLKKERVLALMESALIQSNNRYLPVIHQGEIDIKTKFKPIVSKYDSCVFFTLSENPVAKEVKFSSPTLICIGPEAGFDNDEISEFKALDNCHTLTLKTAILRAPTAVVAATGHILARIG
jgi:16S rRNA (uracil1498-N3)-methyltransferase